MRRREFITLLGGAAVTWPLPLVAQQRTPRVGVLLTGVAPPSRDFELSHELARIGYIEGRNIIYEIRGADGDMTGCRSWHANWSRKIQRLSWDPLRGRRSL